MHQPLHASPHIQCVAQSEAIPSRAFKSISTCCQYTYVKSFCSLCWRETLSSYAVWSLYYPIVCFYLYLYPRAAKYCALHFLFALWFVYALSWRRRVALLHALHCCINSWLLPLVAGLELVATVMPPRERENGTRWWWHRCIFLFFVDEDNYLLCVALVQLAYVLSKYCTTYQY